MERKARENQLGYTFRNPLLLQRALTHSSFAHENGLGAAESNERLEFLGDAVLELIVSDFLFRHYDSFSEGELTKCRSGLVCEISLSKWARQLQLGAHLRLSNGESASGGRERDSILADAFEAIVGAIFLDSGLEDARAFVLDLLSPQVRENHLDCVIADHKTTLQELLQKNSREPAVYAIISETGPAHAKHFTASVSHEGRLLGKGCGKTKKEAEQNAALSAIKKCNI